MADGTDIVEGNCVGIPELLRTDISVLGAVGNEVMDGDGVVGMPAVSRLGFSHDVGAEPNDGDCVTGTPDMTISGSVMAPNGSQPTDGEAIVRIPEVLIGSRVSLSVGTVSAMKVPEYSLYNNDRDNNQQLSYRWKRKEKLRANKRTVLKES